MDKSAWDWEVDAGWIVDTPWVGLHAAVVEQTKEAALATAQRSLSGHIRDLEERVKRWQNWPMKAEFMKAVD